MGWMKINPRAGGPGRIPPVTVSISDRGGGKRKLVVRIAQDFARKGGFSDNRSCRADVFMGDGPDFGRLKIEESRAGGFKVHAAKVWGPISIILAIQTGWPQTLAPTPCPAEVVPGGGIAFRLPWADGADQAAGELGAEQSPRPPSPQAGEGRGEGPGWIDSDTGDALVFTHGGKEITLGPRAYAVATKLKAAMGKGFMDNAALMEAAGVQQIEYLRNAISTLRPKLKPLGLEIEAVPKLGYVMREKQAAPTAAASIGEQDGGEDSPTVPRQEAAPAELAG